MSVLSFLVIPAKAGISTLGFRRTGEIPAFAGMTEAEI